MSGQRLNYHDAAAYLGIPTGTLRSMVHRKLIPHYRLGPHLVRFDLAELEQWLRAHSVAANQQEEKR